MAAIGYKLDRGWSARNGRRVGPAIGAGAATGAVRIRTLATAACPWIADGERRIERIALIPIGFLPVTLIAASTFGVALRPLAIVLLLPALGALVAVMVRCRTTRSLVLTAVVAGVVATSVYDVLRFSFLGLGWMDHDPIPHIGTALGLRPAWVFGYLWRYLGNGSGAAVAFFALGWRGVKAGILFGLFVCAGLLAVLAVSPRGQEMLFPLNAATVMMATLGHILYGTVLGALRSRVGGLAATATGSDSGIVKLTCQMGSAQDLHTSSGTPAHEIRHSASRGAAIDGLG